MDATKLTAQEQETEKKLKFSFSGATLYGIAVIGSGFSSYRKRFIATWSCLLVMLELLLLVILLAVCLAETAGYFNKMAEPSNIPKQPLRLCRL